MSAAGDSDRKHPGQRLLEEGSEVLTDAELLAILVSTGDGKRSAMDIGQALMDRFQSLLGLAQRRFEEILAIKGIGKVKLCRIAAAYEISRRVVDMTFAALAKEKEMEEARAKRQGR